MTIGRSVRRTELARDLDRQRWAGADRVQFGVEVLSPTVRFGVDLRFEGNTLKSYNVVRPVQAGSAPTTINLTQATSIVSGPYWFGRAFDSPPFFTYSASNKFENAQLVPFMAGVTEWHQDEKGMYIGVTLWMSLLTAFVPVAVEGAYIHLARRATQLIAATGEAISWDTVDVEGYYQFDPQVPIAAVVIPEPGYYNISILAGWSTFTGGGSITIKRNAMPVWPPADDPGLWTSTSSLKFEGTAHAIPFEMGDTLSVVISPVDAAAQTLKSATMTAYLVDRTVEIQRLYAALVLSHGPLAYWRLGESSGINADEIAGHAAGPFDGTYTNSPNLGVTGLITDGSGDTAVAFAGSNYVSIGDQAEMDFAGTEPFTVEAWINPTSGTTNSQGFVVKAHGYSPGDHDGWSFFRINGNQVHFTRFDRTVEHNVSGLVTENTANHVVATYDGTTLKLYINGTLVNEDATALSITAHTTEARIGIGDIGGSPTAGIVGIVDEVALYARALSQAEISEHYKVGRGSV